MSNNSTDNTILNEFIKVDNNTTFLAFAKSHLLKVYPCGRRRARDVTDSTGAAAVKNLYPFDPEARLNTELNNRKGSALNGFAESYIKSIERVAGLWVLSFVIGHYSFELTLSNSEDKTAEGLVEALGTEFAEACSKSGFECPNIVYLNIKLEKQALIQGDILNAQTWVLKGQSRAASTSLEADLDILNSNASAKTETGSKYYYQNYYFAGLSFSTVPLTGEMATTSKKTTEDGLEQIFSLALLKKDNDTWVLTERAKLPDIQHGETPGSISVSGLEAGSVEAESILWKSGGQSSPVKILDVIYDEQNKDYQLTFTSAIKQSKLD